MAARAKMGKQRDDIKNLLARQDTHVPRLFRQKPYKLGIQETSWLLHGKFTCCAPKPARRKTSFFLQMFDIQNLQVPRFVCQTLAQA